MSVEDPGYPLTLFLQGLGGRPSSAVARANYDPADDSPPLHRRSLGGTAKPRALLLHADEGPLRHRRQAILVVSARRHAASGKGRTPHHGDPRARQLTPAIPHHLARGRQQRPRLQCLLLPGREYDALLPVLVRRECSREERQILWVPRTGGGGSGGSSDADVAPLRRGLVRISRHALRRVSAGHGRALQPPGPSVARDDGGGERRGVQVRVCFAHMLLSPFLSCVRVC